MILEGEQVGVGLEAHGAMVDTDCVSVFVVQERAGVPVGTATLLTSVETKKETESREINFFHSLLFIQLLISALG